ncbi:uncharacterized protein LOC120901363 [Anopheles arabiensis]|uniref:uncharacterized protein LOC120901363 n=1 Tax=Anopheles arabiensis TaxID=7173 RepID=UPI001AAD2706|nr:uncharacterized protein LOC120901363 [Anopheles arabiensis]
MPHSKETNCQLKKVLPNRTFRDKLNHFMEQNTIRQQLGTRKVYAQPTDFHFPALVYLARIRQQNSRHDCAPVSYTLLLLLLLLPLRTKRKSQQKNENSDHVTRRKLDTAIKCTPDTQPPPVVYVRPLDITITFKGILCCCGCTDGRKCKSNSPSRETTADCSRSEQSPRDDALYHPQTLLAD